MPKRAITPEDIEKMIFLGDPQLSPTGKQVLFSHKTIGKKNNYVTNLFTVDLDGPIRQWTQGEAGAGHGRWSPDGEQIAFVAGREKPKQQIYLIPTKGGEARKLSDLPEGSIGGFQWSPDGKYLAFTFRDKHEDWTDEATKAREQNGGSTPPRVNNSGWYRRDGDGYFMDQRYALYLLDIATGEHRQLYAGSNIDSYDFDWSPDSKELIVAHSAQKRPLYEEIDDQLYRLDLKGNAKQLKGLPGGNKNSVRWSPDGKWIAYAGNPKAVNWGVNNEEIWVVPADGGEARNLTESQDHCFGTSTLSDAREAGLAVSMEWAEDNKSLYAGLGYQGNSYLVQISIAKGDIKLITPEGKTAAFGNAIGDKAVVLIGDSTHLAEVALVDLKKGDLKMLTSFNKAFLDGVKVAKPEEIWLDSSDGWKVHAWVMKPADLKDSKRYPAVLEVHGGPHAQYGNAFFHEFQVLAAAGYVVVYSNPRGSKGYGERHTKAIEGKWGDRDWEDVQAVTRWMQHQPFIHPGQIGIMGGSYGGYMTNWAVGHSKDYKAAITDRCVSNMVSMGGTSDFPLVTDFYWKGYFYGNLDKIKVLWEQSPIAYFDKVTTPMLIIHSEGDLRCNVEQSEQVFTALQIQGIDSRFVRYPQSTSHGMSRMGPPDLRKHRLGEILNWWAKYL